MTQAQHYTFGDGDAAAQRLVLLAAAFEPSSRQWLQSLARTRPGASCECAVDLGCGPGLTTALLAQVLAPARLYGIDQSPRLLERARANVPAATELLAHDLGSGPLPVPPADVVYARFLLTHLAAPAELLRQWLQALRPGGVLLLEETAALHSANPIMTRYYELVAELQAHYRQTTYIGRELAALAQVAGATVLSARVEPIQLPAATMARLHALNIQTWGQDEHARSAFDRDELSQLASRLGQIADGAPSPPVTCEMAQVILTRT